MEKDFLPRTGCSCFKLKDSMFRMNIRRKYCTVRWWGTGASCLELGMPKCPRSSWMGLCATWCSKDGRGVGLVDLWRFLPAENSLWICDYTFSGLKCECWMFHQHEKQAVWKQQSLKLDFQNLLKCSWNNSLSVLRLITPSSTCS